MFQLGLSDRNERCHNYIQLITSTILRSQAALQSHVDNSLLLAYIYCLLIVHNILFLFIYLLKTSR